MEPDIKLVAYVALCVALVHGRPEHPGQLRQGLLRALDRALRRTSWQTDANRGSPDSVNADRTNLAPSSRTNAKNPARSPYYYDHYEDYDYNSHPQDSHEAESQDFYHGWTELEGGTEHYGHDYGETDMGEDTDTHGSDDESDTGETGDNVTDEEGDLEEAEKLYQIAVYFAKDLRETCREEFWSCFVDYLDHHDWFVQSSCPALIDAMVMALECQKMEDSDEEDNGEYTTASEETTTQLTTTPKNSTTQFTTPPKDTTTPRRKSTTELTTTPKKSTTEFTTTSKGTTSQFTTTPKTTTPKTTTPTATTTPSITTPKPTTPKATTTQFITTHKTATPRATTTQFTSTTKGTTPEFIPDPDAQKRVMSSGDYELLRKLLADRLSGLSKKGFNRK